jgi:hypothetical protein
MAHNDFRVPPGPTIYEIGWRELMVVVERLETGTDAEDGLDVGRAQGMAMMLAIFHNPAHPNIEEIRAESVRRWAQEVVE